MSHNIEFIKQNQKKFKEVIVKSLKRDMVNMRRYLKKINSDDESISLLIDKFKKISMLVNENSIEMLFVKNDTIGSYYVLWDEEENQSTILKHEKTRKKED